MLIHRANLTFIHIIAELRLYSIFSFFHVLSPFRRICISPYTRKKTHFLVDGDKDLTSCFWLPPSISFLNYIILFLSLFWSLWPMLSKRFYLASEFVSSWKQNGIQFTLWSTLNCLSLAGFVKCSRVCHGGNLFWNSRIHLHPYCILCQGFRKVKHSHWVHRIDRGHSSLQTKTLDDIYSWTRTISTVK